MFTGIIEALGTISAVKKENPNRRFVVQCPFASELKADQSLAHNGVCLTVEKVFADTYEVVAVEETLKRSDLGRLKPGDLVNLERSMKVNDRLDGHLVQGHVDETAVCIYVENRNGSRLFTFQSHPVIDEDRSTHFAARKALVVEKGSICVNGVSLTVASIKDLPTATGGEICFSVAIIPHTYEHTNFKNMKEGDLVNLEYDIIGKYVQRTIKSEWPDVIRNNAARFDKE